jgi:hypothetical protein
MEAPKKIRGNPGPREGLLEKLERFQQAGEAILPQHTREQRKDNLEALRGAARELREYLALHLAPKELSEWRELPDSNLEIAAFGYELKMEHADLQRELGDLIREIEEYEKVLDREEAATRIALACKALVMRIARHAAGEQAELGRFTA